MLKVLGPSMCVSGKTLLQGLSVADYQLLIMHLSQMLSQLDLGLEAEKELDFYQNLGVQFILGLGQDATSNVEQSRLGANALELTFSDDAALYLNIQKPDDRSRMVNSRSLDRPAFLETIIHALRYSLAPPQKNTPLPRYFLITNLYEWYFFPGAELTDLLATQQALGSYFQGWQEEKPGFRSRETLEQLIRNSLSDEAIPCAYFSFYGMKEALLKTGTHAQSRLMPIGLFFQELLKSHTSTLLDEVEKELAYIMGLAAIPKGDLSHYRIAANAERSSLLHHGSHSRIQVLSFVQRAFLSKIVDTETLLALEKEGILSKDSRNLSFSKEPLTPYPHSLISPQLKDRSLDPQTYFSLFSEAIPFELHGRIPLRETYLPHLNPGLWSEIWGHLCNSQHLQPYPSPEFVSPIIGAQLRALILRKFNTTFSLSCQSWEEVMAHAPEFSSNSIRALLLSVKVIDLCCGQGHFLLTALHELVVIHSELRCLSDKIALPYEDLDFLRIGEGLYPTHAQGELIGYPEKADGNTPGTAQRRLHEALFNCKLSIIRKCLYGLSPFPLDIQVSKNKLLFSLLSNHYQYGGQHRFKWVGLKGFEPKIYLGNPLLSTLYPTQERTQSKLQLSPSDPRILRLRSLQKQLASLQQPLTLWDKPNTESHVQQEQLQGEIHRLEEQIQDPENLWKLYTPWQELFPFLWDGQGTFRGFDMVASAPPAIRQEKFKSFNPYLKDRYKSYDSQGNYYLYLMELGIRMLKPMGRFSFIVPDKWQNAQYAHKFRSWLNDQADFHSETLNRKPHLPANYHKHNLILQGRKKVFDRILNPE